jgi:hypothetical protein
MTTKWPVTNAWVNKAAQGAPNEVSRYFPDSDTMHRERSSYLMDLVPSGSKNQFIIKVKNEGPDGPTKQWDPLTLKLLLNMVLDVNSPSQLSSAPNVSLEKVIKQTFGKWKFVTMTVDLEIKTDPETKDTYREYTTTMVWSENDGSEDKASLSPTTTSYKWRD